MYIVSLTGRQQVANYELQLAHGKTLTLDSPKIMGIINLAPDSFCSKTRFSAIDAAIDYAKKIVDDGADIIDIGAEPTNPSLNPHTSEELEIERLSPVVSQLAKQIDIPISIDTSKPKVMQAMIDLGAHMINDVRGFRVPGALETVAKTDVALCVMHMRYPNGVPESGLTFDDPQWRWQIKEFLQEQVAACEEKGISASRIVLDPGIGFGSFGKSMANNCELLQNLAYFQDLELPLLIGASRKTFIGDILQAPEQDRVAGSIAAAVVAAIQGVHLIRVHDVKETVDAIKITRAIVDEGK